MAASVAGGEGAWGSMRERDREPQRSQQVRYQVCLSVPLASVSRWRGKTLEYVLLFFNPRSDQAKRLALLTMALK
jgi:hypothetical protein